MVSSRLRRVRVMEIFVELSLKYWTVLGVCLSLVSMIALHLAIPWLLVVLLGVPAAGHFFELVQNFALVNKLL